MNLFHLQTNHATVSSTTLPLFLYLATASLKTIRKSCRRFTSENEETSGSLPNSPPNIHR
jgi:hypothetical protein